jgi:hypothetical protein
LEQYGDYVQNVVRMTRKYDAMYEIWNEYNLRVAYEPKAPRLSGEGDPSDIRAAVHYAKIANVGVAAVKRADPTAKVLVGAVGIDPDWKWTMGIVKHGALRGADGLSVHVYNNCLSPDDRGAAEMIDRLSDLQSRLRAVRGGQTTPIYVTEFGWSTITPATKCGLTPERQGYAFAHYILQTAAIPWLKGSWAYELKDEGERPESIEDNFGIYRYDDTPKPSACFAAQARRLIENAKSVELRRTKSDAFVLRGWSAGRQFVAVWSSRVNPRSVFSFAGDVRKVRFMCGRTVQSTSSIPLSQAPVIAEFGANQPVTVAIAARD